MSSLKQYADSPMHDVVELAGKVFGLEGRYGESACMTIELPEPGVWTEFHRQQEASRRHVDKIIINAFIGDTDDGQETVKEA